MPVLISEEAAAAMRVGVWRLRKPSSSVGPWAPQALRRVEGWDLERGREEKGTGGPVMVVECWVLSVTTRDGKIGGKMGRGEIGLVLMGGVLL